MTERPPVAIIMGSQSDWETMKNAADTLEALEIAYDARIISAHRTPDRLVNFAKSARDEGFKVIIAGAGGAAHLPGMAAAMTPLPVFGVPVQSRRCRVRTVSFDRADAGAAFRSARWPSARQARSTRPCWRPRSLRCRDEELADRLDEWRERQSAAVAEYPMDDL